MLTGPENLRLSYETYEEVDDVQAPAERMEKLAEAQLLATYALIHAVLEIQPGDGDIGESWYSVTKWG